MVPLQPEEAMQLQPSVLGEGARTTMTHITGAGGSRTSADQTEYARGETTVGEVGEGVPIGEGDDEPAKGDVQPRRRGRRRRRASPRAPSNSPYRTVECEEEAGEVDADVVVVARGRQAMGDSTSISDRVKIRETKNQIKQQL